MERNQILSAESRYHCSFAGKRHFTVMGTEVTSINRKKRQAGGKTVPLYQKQRYLEYQHSQRAGGKHGEVFLFLSTMLFGHIVLRAQSSHRVRGLVEIHVTLQGDPGFLDQPDF